MCREFGGVGGWGCECLVMYLMQMSCKTIMCLCIYVTMHTFFGTWRVACLSVAMRVVHSTVTWFDWCSQYS